MSLRLPFSLILMTALAFAPSVVQAADELKPNPQPTQAINTTCVMCGKDIGADGKTLNLSVSDGKATKMMTMACCSQMCSDEFMKDPAAAMKPRFGKNASGPKTQYK